MAENGLLELANVLMDIIQCVWIIYLLRYTHKHK